MEDGGGGQARGYDVADAFGGAKAQGKKTDTRTRAAELKVYLCRFQLSSAQLSTIPYSTAQYSVSAPARFQRNSSSKIAKRSRPGEKQAAPEEDVTSVAVAADLVLRMRRGRVGEKQTGKMRSGPDRGGCVQQKGREFLAHKGSHQSKSGILLHCHCHCHCCFASADRRYRGGCW